MDYVTTCVVVWIEITSNWMRSPNWTCHHLRGGVDWNPRMAQCSFSIASPPAWWCGLKSRTVLCQSPSFGHHLRGGVDWNIRTCILVNQTALSPPAWWCGLKSVLYWSLWQASAVTTCVVVWIEIRMGNIHTADGWSHHLRGGVDWNNPTFVNRPRKYCHHLRGGVDWNLYILCHLAVTDCHHLRGGVDWNSVYSWIIYFLAVTTCVVVWIEIEERHMI